MEYNKNKFDKVNDKKVLHKIKKHWVVVSLALLSAIGAGGAATTANASTTGQSLDNANHSSQLNHALNTQKTGLEKVSSDQNSQNSANHSANSNNAIQNQAATLHNRILRANYLGNSVKSINTAKAINQRPTSGNDVQRAITLHNRIIRSTHNYLNNQANHQTETVNIKPHQTQMSAMDVIDSPMVGGDEAEGNNSLSATDVSDVKSALRSVASSAGQIETDYASFTAYTNSFMYNNTAVNELENLENGTHTEWSQSDTGPAPHNWYPYTANNSDLSWDGTNEDGPVSASISTFNSDCTNHLANQTFMNSAYNASGTAHNESSEANKEMGSVTTSDSGNYSGDLSSLTSNVNAASQELSSAASAFYNSAWTYEKNLQSVFSDTIGDDDEAFHGPYTGNVNFHGKEWASGDYTYNGLPIYANAYNGTNAVAYVQNSDQLYNALENSDVNDINVMGTINMNYHHGYLHVPGRNVLINGNIGGQNSTINFNSSDCFDFHSDQPNDSDNHANIKIQDLNINGSNIASSDGPFTNRSDHHPSDTVTFDNVTYQNGPALINTNCSVIFKGNNSVTGNQDYNNNYYDTDLPNVRAARITVEPGASYSGSTVHGDVWKVGYDGDVYSQINIGHGATVNLSVGDQPNTNSPYYDNGEDPYYGIAQYNGNLDIHQDAKIKINQQDDAGPNGKAAVGALYLDGTHTNIDSTGATLNVQYQSNPNDSSITGVSYPVNIVNDGVMNVANGGTFKVQDVNSDAQAGSGNALVYVSNGSHLKVTQNGNLILTNNHPLSGFTLLNNAASDSVNVENPGEVGLALDDDYHHNGQLISHKINAYSVREGNDKSLNISNPSVSNVNIGNNQYEVTIMPTDANKDTALGLYTTSNDAPAVMFRNSNHTGDVINKNGSKNGAGFYLANRNEIKGDLLVNAADSANSPVYIRVSDNDDNNPELPNGGVSDAKQPITNNFPKEYTLKFISNGDGSYREYVGHYLYDNHVNTDSTSEDGIINLPFAAPITHFRKDQNNWVRVTAHCGVNNVEQELYDHGDEVLLHTADINPEDSNWQDEEAQNPDPNPGQDDPQNYDPVIWNNTNLENSNQNQIVPDNAFVTVDYKYNGQLVKQDYYDSFPNDSNFEMHVNSDVNVISDNGAQYYVVSDASNVPDTYPNDSSVDYQINVKSAADLSSAASNNVNIDNSEAPYSANQANNAYYNSYYDRDVNEYASSTVNSESSFNAKLLEDANNSDSNAINAASSAIATASSEINSMKDADPNDSSSAVSAESLAKSAHSAAASADSVITSADSSGVKSDQASAAKNSQIASDAANAIANDNVDRNAAENAAASASSAASDASQKYGDANYLSSLASDDSKFASAASSNAGNGNIASSYASQANSAASQANYDNSIASVDSNLASSYASVAKNISNAAAGTGSRSSDISGLDYNEVHSANVNAGNVANDSFVSSDSTASSEVNSYRNVIAIASESINNDNVQDPTSVQSINASQQASSASNAASSADRVEANIDSSVASSEAVLAERYIRQYYIDSQSAALASASGLTQSVAAAYTTASEDIHNIASEYSTPIRSASANASTAASQAKDNRNEVMIHDNSVNYHAITLSSGSAASYAHNTSENASEAQYKASVAISALDIMDTYSNKVQIISVANVASSASVYGSNAASDYNVNSNAPTSSEVNGYRNTINSALNDINNDLNDPSNSAKASDAIQQASSASSAASVAAKSEASIDSTVADSEAINANDDASAASVSASSAIASADNLPSGVNVNNRAVIDKAHAAANDANNASNDANNASSAASDTDSYAAEASDATDDYSAASYAKLASRAASITSLESSLASNDLSAASSDASTAANETSHLNSKENNLNAESATIGFAEFNGSQASMDANVRGNSEASSAISSANELIHSASASVSDDSFGISEHPHDSDNASLINDASAQASSVASVLAVINHDEASVNSSAASSIAQKASQNVQEATADAQIDLTDLPKDGSDAVDRAAAYKDAQSAEHYARVASDISKSANHYSNLAHIYSSNTDRVIYNNVSDASNDAKLASSAASAASGILDQISENSTDVSGAVSGASSAASLAAARDGVHANDDLDLDATTIDHAAHDTNVRASAHVLRMVEHDNNVIRSASNVIAGDPSHANAMKDLQAETSASSAAKEADSYEAGADFAFAVPTTTNANKSASSAEASGNTINNNFNALGHSPLASSYVNVANVATGLASEAAHDAIHDKNLVHVESLAIHNRKTNGSMASSEAIFASEAASAAAKESSVVERESSVASSANVIANEKLSEVKDNYAQVNNASNHAKGARSALASVSSGAQTVDAYNNDVNAYDSDIKSRQSTVATYNNDSANTSMNTISNSAASYSRAASNANVAASKASNSAKDDYLSALNMISAVKAASKAGNTIAAENAERSASLDQSAASDAVASANQDVSNASTAADQIAAQSTKAINVLSSVRTSAAKVAAAKAQVAAQAAAQDVVYDAITGSNANDEVVSNEPASLSGSIKPSYNSDSANHALAAATSASNNVAGIINTANLLSNLDQAYHNDSANASLASAVNGVDAVATNLANDSLAANSANQLASNYANSASQDADLAVAAAGQGNDDAANSDASNAEDANRSASAAFDNTINNVKAAVAEVSNAENYANVANSITTSLSGQARTAGQNAKDAVSDNGILSSVAAKISPASQNASDALNKVNGANNQAHALSSEGQVYQNSSANAHLISDVNVADVADQNANSASAAVANAENVVNKASTDASSQVASANWAATDASSNSNRALSDSSAAWSAANRVINDASSANTASSTAESMVAQASQDAVSAQSAVNDALKVLASLAVSAASGADQVALSASVNASRAAVQASSANPSLASANSAIASDSTAVQSASSVINSYDDRTANAQFASIFANFNTADFNVSGAINTIKNDQDNANTNSTVASQQASSASSAMNGANSLATASNLNSANNASASVVNDSNAINSNVAKIASIASQINGYAVSATNLITSLNSNAFATASNYARSANNRAASLAKIGTNVNNSAASASQNAASASQASAAVQSASDSINGYHNSSANQIMKSLSASASAANQAAASEQASIANAAQQVNNRINAANQAASSAANFAKNGNVNSASSADANVASLANDVNQASSELSAGAQSLANAVAKLNGIKNYNQFLNIKNLNAQAASGAAQIASQAMVEVNGLQSSVAAQISAKVADENRSIAYDSSSASNYQDSSANVVMSNAAQNGSADNSSAGSYNTVVVNAIQSASQNAVAASSAARMAASAANVGNGSLAVSESNAVSNYAANVNSLSATASTAVNSMELVSLSAASTVAETNHLLSSLSARTTAQSCVIGINYVDAQNSEISHVTTTGFKGSAFNLASYINGAPAGYKSVQVLYGDSVSAYEPGDQEITIKVVPTQPSSASNGSNGQPADPNWDANNGNPSVAPSSNSIYNSNGNGHNNSDVNDHSHGSSNKGRSGHSVDPNANNNADIDFNHRHHNHQTNNHDDSDVPSDVPSDDGGSDTGDQTPDNDAGDDQESNDPSANEPTTDDDDPSDSQEFRNGVNDARRGLSMQSNNPAYVQGYDDFNKAKLPQTGENHQHVGMATAMMMALAIASMGFGKASDRRRHNE